MHGPEPNGPNMRIDIDEHVRPEIKRERRAKGEGTERRRGRERREGEEGEEEGERGKRRRERKREKGEEKTPQTRSGEGEERGGARRRCTILVARSRKTR